MANDDELDDWLKEQSQLLDTWRKNYPSSKKQTESAKRFQKIIDDPIKRQRLEWHLNNVLERFRPDLENRLIQRLPLWYLANFLCLKWSLTMPDWLANVNRKFVIWTVVKEFPSKDSEHKDAVSEYMKIQQRDVKDRGRHSKPGTEAVEILDDIRAFMSYKLAELINSNQPTKLKAKDLSVRISKHLNISEDTLKDKRRRAQKYFQVPQTNSDAIIFRIDVRGIEHLIK